MNCGNLNPEINNPESELKISQNSQATNTYNLILFLDSHYFVILHHEMLVERKEVEARSKLNGPMTTHDASRGSSDDDDTFQFLKKRSRVDE